MPAPHRPGPVPTAASDRRRHRAAAFKRTLLACAALFSVLFCLLAAQMLLGRDPALGGDGSRARTASAPPAATAGADRAAEGSWVDVALGVVQAVAGGDEGHGDDGSSSSAAPLTSRAS